MFAEVLRTLVEETSGAIGAVVMGYDGIAIDQHLRPVEGVDLGLVAVEYANILKEVKKAAEILQTGELEEVTILTGGYQILIRILSEDYFIGLLMRREGNAGKGRFLLMREAPGLRAELR
ncbi:roadblock/LC7 domain-containing protein [Geoalkalibacter halelectricus]|uniref:Roadblock/LC7 domain-containing protein n=1 Tax=Geoalkalibacter halelectricus TaxID=2847045 RepID=A0ABY5ZQC3_9BACT|nr:roadblock/LC7 domain-containing protein [Geoalkalibacter halelectricus]MDO3376761.1 roadblock/LC7 domain-containing protein [Geoalkalibacter halelectricus]UWZ81288.1 roadblock/LC7 domain-containing protein [Geoalkalibacter halelectricus]